MPRSPLGGTCDDRTDVHRKHLPKANQMLTLMGCQTDYHKPNLYAMATLKISNTVMNSKSKMFDRFNHHTQNLT
jgi:hypothetical protein